MSKDARRYDYIYSASSHEVQVARNEAEFYKQECRRLRRIIDISKTMIGIAILGLITSLLFLLEKTLSPFLSTL